MPGGGSGVSYGWMPIHHLYGTLRRSVPLWTVGMRDSTWMSCLFHVFPASPPVRLCTLSLAPKRGHPNDASQFRA